MIDPTKATSPKNRLVVKNIILNNGQDSWSLADILWDNSPAFGLRWNGGKDDKGFPLSRSHPTWLVLPGDLTEIAAIADALKKVAARKK